MKIFSLKSKKSTIIFIFCGLAILFSGVFTMRAVSEKRSTTVSDTSTPNADGNGATVFELNDAVITRLVLDSLPDNLPLSDVVVHISDDSNIRIDCTLSPSELIDFCAASGVKISPSLKFMAKLLPESVDGAFCFGLTFDSASNKLNLTPQMLSVNGIDLSAELLPDDFSISINQAVNTLFSQKDKKIQSITVTDGKILIDLTDK